MKKVTVKNFIRDFIFLTVAHTLSIGRHGLAFSTKATIQIFFWFFFSLLCLYSRPIDFSVSILIVTYSWFKVVWLIAVTQRCSTKKLFLEISQNSQENTCSRVSFLLKFAGLRRATLLKMRLWHRLFRANFVKFLRTPFLQNTPRQLLLYGFVCRNQNNYQVSQKNSKKPHLITS